MSEPFLAEVRMFGFNFAPRGWAFCDGQIMPINQNQSLFSLLGTVYGGDGRTTFGLPGLRSRTPAHKGEGYQLGQKRGTETVSLTAAEIPAHTHVAKARDAAGNVPVPNNAVLAQNPSGYSAFAGSTNTSLRSGSVTNAGNGQAHNNMQPYTTLTFCIALRGLFPSRN